MLQELAFKDPTGRVYMMRETEALPPLAEGYEWTMVVRPDAVMAEEAFYEPEPEPEPEAEQSDGQNGGFLDIVIPLLMPRADQTAQERAQELVDAMPEDVRGKLSQLFRALVPPKPAELPPFPGVCR